MAQAAGVSTWFVYHRDVVAAAVRQAQEDQAEHEEQVGTGPDVGDALADRPRPPVGGGGVRARGLLPILPGAGDLGLALLVGERARLEHHVGLVRVDELRAPARQVDLPRRALAHLGVGHRPLLHALARVDARHDPRAVRAVAPHVALHVALLAPLEHDARDGALARAQPLRDGLGVFHAGLGGFLLGLDLAVGVHDLARQARDRLRALLALLAREGDGQ